MDQKPLTKEQLQNRQAFAKELAKLLDSHNLAMQLYIDFPQYKEFPAEVLLAIQVFENHKGNFIMRLFDIEPKKENKLQLKAK